MAHLRTDTKGANAHFAQVPRISHSRNAFGISETHKTTIQFDYLYPVYHKFIYPGDTLSITYREMARLTTQIRTLFDDLYIDAHAWFVPHRLTQTNWARYQFNAQPSGPTQDNSALTSAQLDVVATGAGGFTSKSLYDYFGYPTKVNNLVSVAKMNNYLARSYNLIWNNNYRDENLQNAVTVDLGEGPDNPSNYVLLKRGKRHDRFTSSLPFQQKGTAASFGLTGVANVIRKSNTSATWQGYTLGSNVPVGATAALQTNGSGIMVGSGGIGMSWDPQGGLGADLSSASTITVNALRQSVAVQHLLEADARGGTRDVESILHRWGVTVPDYRLQRPEYIGGATFLFDGHVVPQTSATVAGQTPQANLTQFSQSMDKFSINHSFVEHGCFMILISARSNITYQEGLQKEISYYTRYDWYQPEFANLGEVAVKNKEIYYQGSAIAGDDDGTFGYQEYGYELRYGLNRVSGEMRSNYTTSLDSYHMADDYASLPTLSAAWIQSNTPISRNIAVSASTADPIQLNTLVEGKIVRTLPMYSIPGLTRL